MEKGEFSIEKCKFVEWKKETESDTIANYIISEALFEFVRFNFFNELMANFDWNTRIKSTRI